MIPRDLILVRHGQSEGNVAQKASRRGDDCFFTDEHRGRHSRTFRLTDKGLVQARAAGKWIQNNIPRAIGRYYVSDYIRAKETAAHMDLPGAQWRVEFHLRERDQGLMDNITDREKREMYPAAHAQWELDPFLSAPLGGESFANHCLRLKATMLEHWARKYPNQTVIAVCHGHVMRALQVEVEGLGHDDFIRLNASRDLRDKIRNCQILWYTRIDPDSGIESVHPVAVRSVCPWDQDGDSGWQRINRRKHSNDELLTEVNRYPRHITG